MTDYVFGEVVTVSLIRLKSLDRALKIGNVLLKSLKTINVEKKSFDNAWGIFCRQKGLFLALQIALRYQ